MRASAISMRRASPGVMVVVAQQMQRAMDHEMREMVRRPAARRGRLAPDCAEGKDHVARHPGAADRR